VRSLLALVGTAILVFICMARSSRLVRLRAHNSVSPLALDATHSSKRWCWYFDASCIYLIHNSGCIYLMRPMPFFNQIMLAADVHPYVDENVMFICIGHVWMDYGCVTVSL
jgi:hypothetical protein